ncbi:hypothetical protein PISMIDRAFT_350529 [Pisolithus microcarpus 441]|uniref:Uncharacterized protein n=1 Tax=Pisolithus microcarpus 441 TaxID=765257 RepID=A0A0C9Z3E6_9AGAM|nr:hypothetical protein PISMIDRAFT_350529 [Pisolithus microcarpus 441]
MWDSCCNSTQGHNGRIITAWIIRTHVWDPESMVTLRGEASSRSFLIRVYQTTQCHSNSRRESCVPVIHQTLLRQYCEI